MTDRISHEHEMAERIGGCVTHALQTEALRGDRSQVFGWCPCGWTHEPGRVMFPVDKIKRAFLDHLKASQPADAERSRVMEAVCKAVGWPYCAECKAAGWPYCAPPPVDVACPDCRGTGAENGVTGKGECVLCRGTGRVPLGYRTDASGHAVDPEAPASGEMGGA